MGKCASATRNATRSVCFVPSSIVFTQLGPGSAPHWKNCYNNNRESKAGMFNLWKLMCHFLYSIPVMVSWRLLEQLLLEMIEYMCCFLEFTYSGTKCASWSEGREFNSMIDLYQHIIKANISLEIFCLQFIAILCSCNNLVHQHLIKLIIKVENNFDLFLKKKSQQDIDMFFFSTMQHFRQVSTLKIIINLPSSKILQSSVINHLIYWFSMYP